MQRLLQGSDYQIHLMLAKSSTKLVAATLLLLTAITPDALAIERKKLDPERESQGFTATTILNSVRDASKQAVGRALEDDGAITRGSLLLKSDLSNYQGKYVCFAEAKVIQGGTCKAVNNRIDLSLRRLRCGAPDAKMRVTDPYGFRIRSNRPRIRWTGIEQATQYTVVINIVAEREHWLETSDSYINLPDDIPSLPEEELIKVSVIAWNENEIITSGEKLFQVAGQDQLESNASILKTLESLGLPRSELVKDLDAIFINQSLLEETLPRLEAFSSSGFRDLETHILLGDRYIQASKYDKALEQYKRTAAIAQSDQNLTFVSWANNRIEALKHSRRLDGLTARSKTRSGKTFTALNGEKALSKSC